MKLPFGHVRWLVRRELLFEGRLDDLKKKYPGSHDAIDELSRAVKPKHLEWAVKRAAEDGEPVDEIIELVRQFDRRGKNLPRKDLNSYVSLGDLRQAFEELGAGRGELKRSAVEGADRILETADLIVVRPRTRHASCVYGAGTRWCISASESTNYFQSYASNNTLFYFVIDKRLPVDDPLHKVAVSVDRDKKNNILRMQAWNAIDKRIEMPSTWPPSVLSAVMEHAATVPQNPQYELMRSSDPERISVLLQDPSNQEAFLGRRFSSSSIKLAEELLDLGVPDPVRVHLEKEVTHFTNDVNRLRKLAQDARVREEIIKRHDLPSEFIDELLDLGLPNPVLLLLQQNISEETRALIIASNPMKAMNERVAKHIRLFGLHLGEGPPWDYEDAEAAGIAAGLVPHPDSPFGWMYDPRTWKLVSEVPVDKKTRERTVWCGHYDTLMFVAQTPEAVDLAKRINSPEVVAQQIDDFGLDDEEESDRPAGMGDLGLAEASGWGEVSYEEIAIALNIPLRNQFG